MTTTDATYNGWTNYATWRINLEIVDDYINSVEDGELTFEGIADFADWLAEYAADVVVSGFDDRLPIRWYAEAFLDQVNWYEIAKAHTDDNPDLITFTGR